MNREFIAIGMMEYGGLGLLIVVGLFVAALDLVRAIFLPAANRCRVLHHRAFSQRSFSPGQPSQNNQ